MDLIKIIIILLIGVFIGYHNSYRTVILNCPQTISRIINILTRQTARWSSASNQDKSPLVAVLHANYGMGYLMALKDIATPQQIKSVSNINMQKFESEIVKQQDKATLYAVKKCQNYADHLNMYLAKIAKEKD
jgi:hypothetical protein